MGYRDNEPFLAWGGKIDPLTEIRNAGIVTTGRVNWVKATGDSDYSTVKDAVGADRMFNDLQSAVNACRNDKNDYVMVIPQDGGTAFTPAATAGTALSLNKARTHLISVGYTQSVYGYSTTVRGHGTAAAYDTALVKVVAPGCEIAGFRFLGTAGTTANGTLSAGVLLLGTASSGTAHQTWVHDCAIEANLASGGGANGTYDAVQMTATTGPDGARFSNCEIGNAAGPAQAVRLNHNGVRHEFYRTKFLDNAAATGDSMIVAGTGATQYVLFRECELINVNSAAKPASAITGSTTTTNPIMFSYCTGVNITAFGTDPTVYAAPTQSGTNAAGMHNPGIQITGSAPISVA